MTTHTPNSAWSADDIRANAQTWSLEGDAKLLDFMKDLSKKIEERAIRTTHNLHKMQLNLDSAQVALGNTTNRLMSLQHSQFIENRVYDDDETLAIASNVLDGNHSSTEKPNIVDALQYALNSGVKMMDKYYEKVTFELSDDSDDDEIDEGGESGKSAIFRPKDPYRDRPLPYLIGSKDWQEKWHIGLVESDTEDASDIEPIDEMSESLSSSSPSMASLHSHVPASMSESEYSVWGNGATAAVAGPPHKNVKQDIFNESSEEDESNNNNNNKHLATNVDTRHIGRRDELLDKVQITNRTTREEAAPNIPKASTIFRQQSQQAPRVVAANLFDSEPPELDESPIVSSTRNSDRKPPVNLFMDDANDDDDDFDIFGAKKTESVVTGETHSSKVVQISIAPKPIKSINLFDDDDDDDENDNALFGRAAIVENMSKSTIASSAPKSPILSKPAKNALFQNLFDDEPPEDDFDFLTKPSAATIAAIKEEFDFAKENVSSVKVAQPLEIENVPDAVKGDPIRIEPASELETEKRTTKKLLSKINLFEDDDDDDESFEKLAGSKIEIASRKDVESTASLVAQPTAVVEAELPPPLTINLFDFESDEDPFNDTLKPNAPVFDESFESIVAPVKKVENVNYVSSHLFDDLPPDDDDDNFLATPAPTNTKQPSEFYNDFSETVTISNASVSTSQYSFIFNDQPPPDDDLFQSAAKPKKSIAKDSEFSRKLNVFANPEKAAEPTAPIINKPKKLNIGNFDINVAALLPGAKRTVSRSDAAIPNSDRIDGELESVETISIANRVDVNVDEAKRLKNLTRNRAKVQMRRPSTRRGRQQQYQRTLQVGDDTKIDSNSQTVVDTTKIISQNTVVAVHAAEPVAPKSSVRPEEKIQPESVPDDIKSVHEAIPDEKLANKIDKIEQQPPTIESSDLSFLDDSDDEKQDDDDWINVIGTISKTSIATKATQEITTKTKITDSLFGDDIETNLATAEIKSNVNSISSLAFAGDKPPPLLQLSSIFDDIDQSEDDNDIFTPIPHSVEQSSLPRIQAPKTSSSLFDGDDEDDDFFGQPPPLPAAKRNNQTAVIDAAVVQPTISLFGDESFDDDDLFATSKSAIKGTRALAMVSAKATVLNNSKREVASGKLFSDSDGDDEDDLFGSKAKPSSIVAQKSVASNAMQNRITKSTVSSVTDQDPLADLLK